MQKAKRSLAKLKLGMAGVSGSGKTMGALLIAYGLMKSTYPTLPDDALWEKICLIDTENNSGSLYADMRVGTTHIGSFNTIPLSAPYSPSRYREAISCCEQNGIEVIIIDSLTHAWAGEGGSLDKQSAIAAKIGNSYTAWRNVTPEHNKLVEALLQSPAHIIATIRSKTEYAMQKGTDGKNTITKLGLAPIFRDGIEFEFTTMLEIDSNHLASASKDRTAMFGSDFFTITADTGKRFYDWLSEAKPDSTPPTMQSAVKTTSAQTSSEQTTSEQPTPSLDTLISEIDGLARNLAQNATPEKRSELAQTITGFIGTANYTTVTDIPALIKLRNHLKTLL